MLPAAAAVLPAPPAVFQNGDAVRHGAAVQMERCRREPLLKQPPAPAPDHRQDAHDIPVHDIGADECGGYGIYLVA